MRDFRHGLIASFCASICLAGVILLARVTGAAGDFHFIEILGRILTGTAPIAWFTYFLLETVIWGLAFTVAFPFLRPRGALAKGLLFGLFTWLIIVVFVLPFADAGMFGLWYGIHAPLLVLLYQLIHGALLGSIYGELTAYPKQVDEPPLADNVVDLESDSAPSSKRRRRRADGR